MFGTVVCELDTADDLSQGQVSLAAVPAWVPLIPLILACLFHFIVQRTVHITLLID